MNIWFKIESNPLLSQCCPKKNQVFQPNRCTLDEEALNSEVIEASINKKLKSGAVLVNLSAAYDTALSLDSKIAKNNP